MCNMNEMGGCRGFRGQSGPERGGKEDGKRTQGAGKKYEREPSECKKG